jgi:hypothetical protein
MLSRTARWNRRHSGWLRTVSPRAYCSISIERFHIISSFCALRKKSCPLSRVLLVRLPRWKIVRSSQLKHLVISWWRADTLIVSQYCGIVLSIRKSRGITMFICSMSERREIDSLKVLVAVCHVRRSLRTTLSSILDFILCRHCEMILGNPSSNKVLLILDWWQVREVVIVLLRWSVWESETSYGLLVAMLVHLLRWGMILFLSHIEKGFILVGVIVLKYLMTLIPSVDHMLWFF